MSSQHAPRMELHYAAPHGDHEGIREALDHRMKSWFVTFGRPSAGALRLFCLPHAGGSAAAFRRWSDELPADVEVVGVQLPGRGARRGEPAHPDMRALATRLARELRGWDDRPFALFGHSMGALLAFEVARELRRWRRTDPEHLLVSALGAPHRDFQRRRDLHRASDEEIVDDLRRQGGIPSQLLERRDLLDAALPALRADLAACETYAYAEDTPLECPVTAFGGRDDEMVDRSDLLAWRDLTTGRFSLRMLPGGHFYHEARPVALLSVIGRLLTAPAPPAAALAP